MKINTNFQIPINNISLREGTGISNLDSRLWKEVGSDTARYFSDEALVRTRIAIEANYLIFLSQNKIIRKLTTNEKKILSNLHLKIDKSNYTKILKTEEKLKHDVMSIVYIFKNLLKENKCLKDIVENQYVHLGLTSEDVDNIAKSVLIQNFLKDIYLPILKKSINILINKVIISKNIVIPGKTHLQTATPTILGKEIAIYAVRLSEIYKKIKNLKLNGKLMGATGNLSALKLCFPKKDWIKFSKTFVSLFDLKPNIFTTQIETKSSHVELFSNLHLINSILIDMSQDLRLMIGFGWLKQKVNFKEIGSSAMPQKVNPIDLENTQGNSLMANWFFEGLIRQLPISWLQRDLVDKTIQRNLGLPFGYSTIALISLSKGLSKLVPNKEKIQSDLDSDWTIISEGIQNYLKIAGVPNSFNKIKSSMMGNKFSKKEFQQIIQNLNVNQNIKNGLNKITPNNYIGESKRIIFFAINTIRKNIK